METLTLLATLALVGITGWYAWNAHRTFEAMAEQSRLLKLSALIQARAALLQSGAGDNSRTVLQQLAEQLDREWKSSSAAPPSTRTPL